MPPHETSATVSPIQTADEQVRVVMVSGFLGAGKTTALQTIGERLTDQGYTVGMITNDQASGLVDTSILDRTDGTVVEIPGGCFCCNFDELLQASSTISQQDVDILLAEPVGSCTDLVATVINPLRSMYADEFAVAPLTVILDPARVQSYLDETTETLPEEVRYIFRLQIEEADVVVLNKTDMLTDDDTARLVNQLQDRVGDRPVIPLSAKHQDGIDRWLSMIVTDEETDDPSDADGRVTAEGRALTDIDYDTYADGEAKLGWVNLTVTLDGQFEAAQFTTELMDRVHQSLRADSIEVAHLKFSLAAAEDLSHANLTATDAEPRYTNIDLGSVTEGRLVFNARAVGNPEEIRTIATDALTATARTLKTEITIEKEQAFRPEYPEPTHRIDDDAVPASGLDTSDLAQFD